MALTVHRPGAGDFASLRAEFELPESFPSEVLAEAESVAGDPADDGAREDATGLPLVTVDPPGAKDLDQAVCIERRPLGGFRVHYAIADLAAFVPPGGLIDLEARRRGQTLYLPDGNVSLHPPELSEGAASLLPGMVRPSVLWTIDTDSDGEPVSVHVRRALVRSTERFDYDTVAAALAVGEAHPSIAALPALGRLRRELAVRRGAVELQLPEQEIGAGPDGGWVLTRRPRHDVEAWNAEVSLLTGMVAASIMLDAGIGVLRTLPQADDDTVNWLRRSATALGIDWPTDATVAELLAGLDPANPASLALYAGTTRLLRGAGYTSFDGTEPEFATHAGLASPYAHVTAPIRRLVDRFAAEICLAVTHDRPVPTWVRAALAELPELMNASDNRAARVERACLDQVEAWILAEHIGRTFDAVVLRAEETKAEVFLENPPVLGKCTGTGFPDSGRISVRLTAVDVTKRKVSFERA
ncbi:RNB domain-containing ribonuclease [Prauserella cavernicola]|uniref:RNB domain-containing ribonuclease n=1 Tax=Prauserella cavernicola TaxID=2800127 RepID=A0A934R1B3_9PSEU|nr:RNB domain-containing ribonuclease [Prauserella cavernicola]MBK1789008.1 RNB domain-containing ribonuclease [Prauserella cavernicola]